VVPIVADPPSTAPAAADGGKGAERERGRKSTNQGPLPKKEGGGGGKRVSFARGAEALCRYIHRRPQRRGWTVEAGAAPGQGGKGSYIGCHG